MPSGPCLDLTQLASHLDSGEGQIGAGGAKMTGVDVWSNLLENHEPILAPLEPQ